MGTHRWTPEDQKHTSQTQKQPSEHTLELQLPEHSELLEIISRLGDSRGGPVMDTHRVSGGRQRSSVATVRSSLQEVGDALDQEVSVFEVCK